MRSRGDIPEDTETKNEGREGVDFETALTLTGFGKFQWILLMICGLIYIAVGFQNGLAAYIIPVAQCDLEMSSREKGLLNATFLIGGILSAFLWGLLADQIGRRKILIITLLLDALVTLVSSLSQSFSIFATFRFFNGFLIGAPASIACIYLGEFIGTKQRGRCMCFLGFFFTVSWMLLPLAAIAVLPMQWKIHSDGFLFNSWRFFVLLAVIPSGLSSILVGVFLPESPKFLFSKGYEKNALKIMERIFHSNHGTKSYPVKSIASEISLKCSSESETGRNLKKIVADVLRLLSTLFIPPHLYATLLAAALMFCNMYGFYGLALWLPELFDRFEAHYKGSNVSVTVCELTHIASQNFTLENETSYCDNDIDVTIYYNTFITGTACLFGNVLCSLVAGIIGLKFLSVATMSISGLCAIVIYFVNTALDNLIISCFFISFISAANNVITAVVCDLFPTKIRALGSCSTMFAGRLGAVASNLALGYILDSMCEVPVFLMASVLLLGSALSFLLPKTK